MAITMLPPRSHHKEIDASTHQAIGKVTPR
jgi:hypothetical protein